VIIKAATGNGVNNPSIKNPTEKKEWSPFGLQNKWQN